jgi:hypothetical protein
MERVYLELRTLSLVYPATRVLHMDPVIPLLFLPFLDSRVKSGAKPMIHKASLVPAPLQDQPRYKEMAGCIFS